MTGIGWLLATVAGLGRFPVAPGTVGSAVGVLFHLALAGRSPLVQVTTIVVIAVVGVWAAGVTARQVGSPDPSVVIIDEVAGQMLTLALLGPSLGLAVAGFFLFRILDIVKPWPARRLELLPGGLGIMADDLLVAVYGQVLLRVMMGVWPNLLG